MSSSFVLYESKWRKVSGDDNKKYITVDGNRIELEDKDLDQWNTVTATQKPKDCKDRSWGECGKPCKKAGYGGTEKCFTYSKYSSEPEKQELKQYRKEYEKHLAEKKAGKAAAKKAEKSKKAQQKATRKRSAQPRGRGVGSRKGCSRLNLEPCINSEHCHWVVNKGCKQGNIPGQQIVHVKGRGRLSGHIYGQRGIVSGTGGAERVPYGRLRDVVRVKKVGEYCSKYKKANCREPQCYFDRTCKSNYATYGFVIVNWKIIPVISRTFDTLVTRQLQIPISANYTVFSTYAEAYYHLLHFKPQAKVIYGGAEYTLRKNTIKSIYYINKEVDGVMKEVEVHPGNVEINLLGRNVPKIRGDETLLQLNSSVLDVYEKNQEIIDEVESTVLTLRHDFDIFTDEIIKQMEEGKLTAATSQNYMTSFKTRADLATNLFISMQHTNLTIKQLQDQLVNLSPETRTELVKEAVKTTEGLQVRRNKIKRLHELAQKLYKHVVPTEAQQQPKPKPKSKPIILGPVRRQRQAKQQLEEEEEDYRFVPEKGKPVDVEVAANSAPVSISKYVDITDKLEFIKHTNVFFAQNDVIKVKIHVEVKKAVSHNRYQILIVVQPSDNDTSGLKSVIGEDNVILAMKMQYRPPENATVPEEIQKLLEKNATNKVLLSAAIKHITSTPVLVLQDLYNVRFAKLRQMEGHAELKNQLKRQLNVWLCNIFQYFELPNYTLVISIVTASQYAKNRLLPYKEHRKLVVEKVKRSADRVAEERLDKIQAAFLAFQFDPNVQNLSSLAFTLANQKTNNPPKMLNSDKTPLTDEQHLMALANYENMLVKTNWNFDPITKSFTDIKEREAVFDFIEKYKRVYSIFNLLNKRGFKPISFPTYTYMPMFTTLFSVLFGCQNFPEGYTSKFPMINDLGHALYKDQKYHTMSDVEKKLCKQHQQLIEEKFKQSRKQPLRASQEQKLEQRKQELAEKRRAQLEKARKTRLENLQKKKDKQRLEEQKKLAEEQKKKAEKQRKKAEQQRKKDEDVQKRMQKQHEEKQKRLEEGQKQTK